VNCLFNSRSKIK